VEEVEKETSLMGRGEAQIRLVPSSLDEMATVATAAESIHRNRTLETVVEHDTS
jgi:hypothetical protein